MINPADISKNTTATGGSFTYNKHGDTATLAWSTTSPTLVIASSTSVPDSMRGLGVGQALLATFIADAKENGYKIIPLCPFVKARGPRHPDWADVVSA
ncbi:GNAT family N-acetyltransferase [Sphingopyxis yananensis]|uniref:GNAT family N-acetyltransferase n=1 Tax=Sphingopyxis yananensis TaxID=2886687 RepID=UPI001D0FE653|nr:GNAT family N-acetyltransferase [Sphingopyxis yananensis]MCC2602222.1 N-acetyltransferase [Sphingopyxis yananensis]